MNSISLFFKNKLLHSDAIFLHLSKTVGTNQNDLFKNYPTQIWVCYFNKLTKSYPNYNFIKGGR